MREQMQSKIYNHIQNTASIYLFIIILLFIGVIFGAVIVNALSLQQKQDLAVVLNRFFGQISSTSNLVSKQEMFQDSYFTQLKYIGFMWVLGISLIGLPIILILLFMKGIVVGFTVGLLVQQYGWKGFLLSIVSVLPQNFIIIPSFIFIAVISMAFSMRMIRQQFLKGSHEPIWPVLKKYTIAFIVVGIFVGVASLFEVYVTPFLMEKLVGVLSNA